MNLSDDMISLISAGGCAKITSFGAQLLSWIPINTTEVLFSFIPTDLANVDGVSLGGMPVCFPWFAFGPIKDKQPIHGVAHRNFWRKIDISQARTYSSAAFQFDYSPAAGEKNFPHKINAVLRVDVADELKVELTVTNTDDHSYSFEEAFHTYYKVADIKKTSITGVEDTQYLDFTKDDVSRDIQHGELYFTQNTDRIYLSKAKVIIHDKQNQRNIIVSKRGSADTVIWNPWGDEQKTVKNMELPAWRRFVCVETANVKENAINLAPGQKHVMAVKIQVETVI